MTFANSEVCQEAIDKILDEHPQRGLEIGLMFMADSLSKSEIIATEHTDEAIEAQRPKVEREMQAQGLNSRLIRQALQVPVNMRIVELYLRKWAARLPMRNR
jgi:hypothetical protein